MDEGRWVKVPATSGEFGLKIKQLLPGEQYALQKRCDELKDEVAIAKERQATAISKIVDWRDLQDAEGNQIAFDAKLLQDEKFIDALMGCTVIGGRYLMNWLISKINKSDAFVEDEDTSFLAPI
jgi:predicted nuclease with TOPRIM domain